jgi:hypothetical protein
MTMAQHAAAVSRIHFHGFSHSRQKKSRARKKVANDGLEMTVQEPGMWLKLR